MSAADALNIKSVKISCRHAYFAAVASNTTAPYIPGTGCSKCCVDADAFFASTLFFFFFNVGGDYFVSVNSPCRPLAH